MHRRRDGAECAHQADESRTPLGPTCCFAEEQTLYASYRVPGPWDPQPVACDRIVPLSGCADWPRVGGKIAEMSLEETTERAAVRRASRRALTPAALALIAVGITLATAILDHVTIASRSGLARVTFGLPLAWLVQDQTSLDPPFPLSATFVSPWEYPASVAWSPLVFDVLVVFTALYAGLFVVGIARSRLSS
jgi:hypothetical protein